MKLAVVGATGLVGQEILKVIEERNFPFDELYLVASAKSVGQTMTFKGRTYTIRSIEEVCKLAPDIAIFSAGGSTSLEWAPRYAEMGTIVIDNSSAWRMDPTKKLVVPEINANILTKADKIIANPNCSTIQMVVALNPLHKKYKIKRPLLRNLLLIWVRLGNFIFFGVVYLTFSSSNINLYLFMNINT